MKNLSYKTGVTLTELIVSVMIVGVMMLGIVAIEFAMRRSHRTTSDDAELSMRMAAAMTHISNNVVYATGNRGDLGIEPMDRDSDGAGDRLWIRKAGADPTSYGDDQWVVYNHDIEGANRLSFCPVGAPPLSDPYCTDPSQEYTIIMANSVDFRFQPNETTQEFFVQVSLSSRYDITQPVDPLKNREMTSTTRIIPLQHTY